MSIYYKQKFTSPEPIYAKVKEELRSYFASGLIDDLMFPEWTESCLKRFRKSAYKIEETMLDIKNYKAELPCDFNDVREAWMCTHTWSHLFQEPSSIYFQKDCRVDSPVQFGKCDQCFDTETCTTDFLVTWKSTNQIMFRFSHVFLMRPGILPYSHPENHDQPQLGHNSSFGARMGNFDQNSYDIHDNNLVTTFCDGKVHLIYYADTTQDGLIQLVPDNFWVMDYIKKYIIYYCFRQLSNTITDESYNQIEKKRELAKQEQADAYTLADIELKKQTS